MGSASGIFTGSSRYSSDFQAIIDRAVGIASLPMLQMQNSANALRSRSQALTSLDSKVVAVQTALNTLGSVLGTNSYRSSVSDATILSASVAEGVKEGSYSVEVTDFGSNTNTASTPAGNGLQTVSDPSTEGFGVTGPFKLYLNTVDDGEAITITPAGDTLNDLVDAINSSSSEIRATVVNMGGSGGSDYRLTIQHSGLGANTIQLKDSLSNPILDTIVPGTPVKYKINGSAEISNDTRSIQLSPGLTLNLLKQSEAGVATTVTVSRTADGVKNALTSLAQAYNAVLDEVDQHRGQGTGVLKGDSVLAGVRDSLRGMVNYSTNQGGISSLSALGLSFNDQGKLSLDTTVFSSAADGEFDDLAAFLGSSTGDGFLAAATGALNSLQDATTGILKTNISSASSQITDQDRRIAETQTRMDELRASLQQQMAAADALIASMEQQVQYFTAMFEAMRIAHQASR